MKKYITTDKHPELKEGIIFNGSMLGNCSALSHCRAYMNMEELHDSLQMGYIKELQEPEFTKDDMIRFATYFTTEKEYFLDIDIDEVFNNWLDINKNK